MARGREERVSVAVAAAASKLEDDAFGRQDALAAVFSLWRAVFLLVKEQEQEIDLVDEAAKRFLGRIIRRNAIAFSDDLTMRAWSSVYYVENAVYRISKLTGHEFLARRSSPIGTVRDAWNEAFEQPDAYVSGGWSSRPIIQT